MQIQKGTVTYCGGCGLPTINCICDAITSLRTKAEFWILTHEREIRRPTNTGKLIKKLFGDQVTVVVWKRKEAPEAMLRKIQSGQYNPLLVFPAETPELKQRVVDYRPDSTRITAFILLDGTWQEARKIMRKSPYLHSLPILAFNPEKRSKFVLRKQLSEFHLCTFETATTLEKIIGESENAEIMERFFDRYLALFQAGRCGHRLEGSNKTLKHKG